MNFIEGLPKSKEFFVILVVLDMFSKYSHFILLRHLYTSVSVTLIFIRVVVRLHDISKLIVSD